MVAEVERATQRQHPSTVEVAAVMTEVESTVVVLVVAADPGEGDNQRWWWRRWRLGLGWLR